MARPVTVPKLGQSEEVVTIVRWVKREGEPVTKGEVLFEIETDKAVLEVESYFDGTLLKIAVPAGTTVPVLSVVGFVGERGEAVPDIAETTGTAFAVPSAGQPLSAAPSPAAEQLASPPAGHRPTAPVAAAAPRRDELLGGSPGHTHPFAESSTSVAPRVAEQQRTTSGAAVGGRQLSFRISPRAARLARETLIDPRPIRGTGPDGRVRESDVRAYLAERGYDDIHITPAARELAMRENVDVLSVRAKETPGRITAADVERAVLERPRALSRMRQVIASRMVQSTTTIPHFFVTVSADVTELIALREQRKAEGRVYSLNDFVLKAAALALEEFPDVNSATDGRQVWRRAAIHLGIAVSLDQGLVVPVIFDACDLTLQELHDCAAALTAKARAGKLMPAEMSGSTFTISNMGMLDVENFSAIINPGESAILAVSSARRTPVVRGDAIIARSMMKMTLSADHRMVDGAVAARFINVIRQKLEETDLWTRLT